MKLAGDWLNNPATQTVCSVLTAAGYQALFVGGCVRNELLGWPVADVDIATDAEPDVVTRLAAAASIRVIPTGVAHGTVTLVLAGISHEVTTFRQDLATDGRRAEVAFSSDILADAKRRDFTINALYAQPDGTLVDPLHGLADVLARKIRFIGDADARIREDHLRILRFFRFFAWFGHQADGLDPIGLRACATSAALIGRLSRERVGAEMRKLLSAPDPAAALSAMATTGVLDLVLPGAVVTATGKLTELEQRNGFPPRWTRRLAALGGHDAARRLRMSKAEAGALDAVNSALADRRGAAQLAQIHGADAGVDAVLIACARNATPVPRRLQEIALAGASAIFPVGASDLPDTIPAGPETGRALKELRQLWLRSEMTLSRAQLLSDFGTTS